MRVARRSQPGIWISVTAGAHGSWVSHDLGLQHLPALPVPVVSTAGAGDAHLAGLLSGLAAGLPLTEAHALAALVAAVSVTSPHTIHGALDADALVLRSGFAHAFARACTQAAAHVTFVRTFSPGRVSRQAILR